MRTVLLSRYDRSGASSRLRLFQYERYLAELGLQPSRQVFFDERYLADLYAGKSTVAAALDAYLRRAGQLSAARKCDLVWLEKEALPWLPASIEQAAMPKGIPLVVDYDDAVFHRYDQHHSRIIRRVLGQKHDRIMATADLVTAGNEYLADRARRAGARRVEIVPTVVDVDAYLVRPQTEGDDPVIGWIGTPGTWSEYLLPMLPKLVGLACRKRARIHAVGAGAGLFPNGRLSVSPWSEATEVSEIQGMDIGIMPLTDTPWSKGKCGYKLIQYMACGLPVIASPVGVNAEIVEHGVNGFLASSEKEWSDALTALLDNPGLRRQMGAAGRRKVEREYSLQVWGPRVASLLHEAAQKRTVL